MGYIPPPPIIGGYIIGIIIILPPPPPPPPPPPQQGGGGQQGLGQHGLGHGGGQHPPPPPPPPHPPPPPPIITIIIPIKFCIRARNTFCWSRSRGKHVFSSIIPFSFFVLLPCKVMRMTKDTKRNLPVFILKEGIASVDDVYHSRSSSRVSETKE